MPLNRSTTLAALATLAWSAPIPALANADASPQEATAIAMSEPVEQAADIDPAMMQLAAQIVDAGYPEETREALFFASMDQTIAQMRTSLGPYLPSDDPEAVKILDDWIEKYTEESKSILRKHIPSIMDGMAEAYAELFTEEELRDILAFVETPSGKQFFDLMPQVIGSASFAEANQAYIDESMEVMVPAQRELLDQLQDHREKSGEPLETI
ncbi:DUF2059 domain-containing protein [Erythrobacter sp. GH1-10]|uniref:DUF2059 domain-containing protein n=1 Tax=Erythrobacter sp. GH1-10 TaxID=3349334 RepID=UPI003877B959